MASLLIASFALLAMRIPAFVTEYKLDNKISAHNEMSKILQSVIVSQDEKINILCQKKKDIGKQVLTLVDGTIIASGAILISGILLYDYCNRDNEDD
jgi:hypothetical protein